MKKTLKDSGICIEEQILAEVLAQHVETPVVQQNNFFMDSAYYPTSPNRAVYACAVGAGVLFRNLDTGFLSNAWTGAGSLFADYYGVSEDFADGVSAGFEGYVWTEEEWTYKPEDYKAGFDLGQTIAEAVTLDSRTEKA